MTPMERVKRSYSSAPQRLLMPEWPDEQGNPMEIFYTPYTGLDDQTIDAREPKSGAERVVLRFILKAHNDAGRAIFRWSDATALLKEVPFDLLLRVVTATMQTTPTVADARGELDADPNLTFDSSSPANSIKP
jgi:hypothetical protein